jgi:hypothetical protein
MEKALVLGTGPFFAFLQKMDLSLIMTILEAFRNSGNIFLQLKRDPTSAKLPRYVSPKLFNFQLMILLKINRRPWQKDFPEVYGNIFGKKKPASGGRF